MSEGVLALQIARARSEDCHRTVEGGLKELRNPLDLNDQHNEHSSYDISLLCTVYAFCHGSG